MSVTLTREEADELIGVLRAYADGKPLKYHGVVNRAVYALEQDGYGQPKAALTREPAPDAIDALNGPMIFDRNVVATHRVAAPAPRPHRELMEEAREALVRSSAYVHENRGDIVTDNQELAQRIDAALASDQPCAAPGEAGEWEIVHECVPFKQCKGVLLPIPDHREGDRVIVYRRRAPERAPGSEPWCPACEMRCREFGGRSGCCDKPVEWRAPEREGGAR